MRFGFRFLSIIAARIARNARNRTAYSQVRTSSAWIKDSATQLSPRTQNAIAKIDHHMGQDVLTARYFLGDSDQSFPLALVGGGGLPGYNTDTPTNVQLLSASYTKVASPRLLFELRGGWNRFDETFGPEDADFDPSSIGLGTTTDPENFGLPTIIVGDYSVIGANTSLPRGRVDQNWQLFGKIDNVTNIDPPPIAATAANSTAINPSLYDTAGRMYRFGVRVNL